MSLLSTSARVGPLAVCVHVLMAAAMVLCFVPGIGHATSLLVLLVCAGVAALDARADPRRLPALIDVVSMTALTVCALLSGHANSSALHGHSAPAISSAPLAVLAPLGIAGTWAILRVASSARSSRQAHAEAFWSAAMIAVMTIMAAAG